MLSLTDTSYLVFLYSGIIFFVVHLLIYGLGLDQSYFGLALAYIGYSKIGLYWWVFGLLWIGLLLEGMNLGKIIYERIFKSNDTVDSKKKNKKNKKE